MQKSDAELKRIVSPQTQRAQSPAVAGFHLPLRGPEIGGMTDQILFIIGRPPANENTPLFCGNS
jgi:hypothetical protein